ncbi:unnamed protein product [Strongylus vulgaris]|uniref:Uncharacterized protein n=1 Tax=Strongylus vulgaris TaxID=40348 RepID=A0A3P7JAP6_STRVU|nr:unnamed protein product [Strongylus vulgaris]
MNICKYCELNIGLGTLSSITMHFALELMRYGDPDKGMNCMLPFTVSLMESIAALTLFDLFLMEHMEDTRESFRRLSLSSLFSLLISFLFSSRTAVLLRESRRTTERSKWLRRERNSLGSSPSVKLLEIDILK